MEHWRFPLSAFLRQVVETHTEMTEFLLSMVKRGANPRYPRQQDQSDGDVVISDFATTISDLRRASSRVIEKHSVTRGP